jgi:hypothetical protein
MDQPASANGYNGVCVRLARLSNAAAVGSPVLLVLGAIAATAAAPATAQALVQAQASHPAASGQAVLSRARARALSSDVTDTVIMVFRNQVAGLPDTPAHAAARSVAVADLQRSVLSELAAVHARDIASISLVNAVAATVSPGAATLLAANPAVAEVIPDVVIRQAARRP